MELYYAHCFSLTLSLHLELNTPKLNEQMVYFCINIFQNENATPMYIFVSTVFHFTFK